MLDGYRFDWQIIGLTFNILGAFFILNSLYFKHPRRQLEEFHEVGRKRSLRSIRDSVMSMVQLIIGFTFLIFGYVLQIAYQFSLNIDDRENFFLDTSVLTVAAVLIGFMLLVALTLKLFQILWTKWVFRKVLAEFYRRFPEAIDRDPALAKEAGEILGVPRRSDDSVDEYSLRLKRAVGVDPEREVHRKREQGLPVPPRPKPEGEATHPATPPRILS